MLIAFFFLDYFFFSVSEQSQGAHLASNKIILFFLWILSTGAMD